MSPCYMFGSGAVLNAGPRTEQGKLSSARNAFKSGLDAEAQFIPGEKPEDFAALQQDYEANYTPRTPEERYHLDRMIQADWLLRRMARVESELWSYYAAKAGPGTSIGEAFAEHSTIFMRLHRRVTQLERTWQEANAQLQALQSQPEDPFDVNESITETAEMASFLTMPSPARRDPLTGPTETAPEFPRGPRHTTFIG